LKLGNLIDDYEERPDVVKYINRAASEIKEHVQ
jgi:hypothetical protein